MDVRKLKELCKAALPLLEKTDCSKPTPKSLLRALLEKTIEQVDSGINAANIMFTTVEMVGLVKNVNESQAKKFKADHYAETVKLLAKINKLKKDQGYPDSKFILELSDTGELGGAKNKKHHFLKVVEKEDTNYSKNIETNDIKYQAVQLPKTNFLAKPFMSIELSSWRLILFLGLPISILVIGLLLFLQSVITPTSSELSIFLLFIAVVTFVGYSTFPFYEANHFRIAIAPQWMMKFKQVTAQLESIPLNKKRKNGRPYRKLEFVIYEGKCPVCQNIVEVENGKRQFKGRLIGFCSESPREHVFSFDHVTKKGKLLY